MFAVEIDREEDSRWFAEVPELSGVMAYGRSRDEAVTRTEALALRVLDEGLEHRTIASIARGRWWFAILLL